MPPPASNILIAVDAELGVLERRIAKLKEIRALALDLDGARLPAAATAVAQASRTVRAPKRQSPALTTADVIEPARELLGEGPTTIGKIFEAIGRSRTERGVEVIESALGELGAHAIGRARGGGDLYALPRPDAGDEEAEQLHAIVREILQRQVDCSDEEIQYQLRRRYGIEISLVDARRERELASNGNGALHTSA